MSTLNWIILATSLLRKIIVSLSHYFPLAIILYNFNGAKAFHIPKVCSAAAPLKISLYVRKVKCRKFDGGVVAVKKV